MAAPIEQEPGVTPDARIGFLLKHVHERWLRVHRAALEPLGVSGRQLAVLHTVSLAENPSQQEAASTLGIDRTSMVALTDELEGLGLLAREVDPADRRRNVVRLTERGRAVLRDGLGASDAAEKRFLSPLDRDQQLEWRQSLRTLARTDEA
jgi:DNA-binding MarR family transcriptional regulator